MEEGLKIHEGEGRAANRARSQSNRKRFYHAPHFTHGAGQGSNSYGYTGALQRQASQMPL